MKLFGLTLEVYALWNFRAHRSAAPLKRLSSDSAFYSGIGFPRSSERGPIEAVTLGFGVGMNVTISALIGARPH